MLSGELGNENNEKNNNRSKGAVYMEGGRSWHQKDPGRRIIPARHMFSVFGLHAKGCTCP